MSGSTASPYSATRWSRRAWASTRRQPSLGPPGHPPGVPPPPPPRRVAGGDNRRRARRADPLLELHDPVEQRLRPGRAAGHVHVDRDDLVDALGDRVGGPGRAAPLGAE